MSLLVIIRPEPGAAATLAQARAGGLEAVSYPLFEVEPVAWAGPEPEHIDALLIGSANCLRHGGPGIGRYRGKPSYAVGTATARAAAACGLAVVASGCGGMQALLAQLAPDHRRVLRLAGRARVALALPPGICLTEQVVYDSRAIAMPAELARLLTTHALAGAVILLHSAAAAQHFAQSCEKLDICRRRLRLAALGPRIAPRALGSLCVNSQRTSTRMFSQSWKDSENNTTRPIRPN